ncbi:MAG: hypothetical protein A2939_05170 [Parcubacteria group bacterium RIFCSPLOWO2_01_FULL_48_18]|nr:MAG: hypothetical protein A2939_05170 [Parcubacteria group bacterium RIFCSPLOWO2_01_FULL_48_18]
MMRIHAEKSVFHHAIIIHLKVLTWFMQNIRGAASILSRLMSMQRILDDTSGISPHSSEVSLYAIMPKGKEFWRILRPFWHGPSTQFTNKIECSARMSQNSLPFGKYLGVVTNCLRTSCGFYYFFVIISLAS